MSFLNDLNPLNQVKSLLGGGADPGKKQLAQVLKLHGQAKAENAAGFASAIQANRMARNTIAGGYGRAKNEIGRIGRAGRMDILDRERMDTGLATQNAITGGNLGTTVYSSLARGIRSDTSRALGRLDEMMATLFANNEIGGATAEANIDQGLAGIYQNQAQSNAQLTSNTAATVAGVQHQDPNGWIQSLFQVGGQLGSAALLA